MFKHCFSQIDPKRTFLTGPKAYEMLDEADYLSVAQVILEHKWFQDFEIEELREKVIKAPWVPEPIKLGPA